MKEPDCIIIGGGPSGVAAASRIAQLGGKAVLVERDLLGGVCTNWGCIPTKAMISAARHVYEAGRASSLGVRLAGKPDFRSVVAHRDLEVEKSRAAMLELIDRGKVRLVQGDARILDGSTVEISGKRMRARTILIATGSEVTTPPFVKLGGRVLSSKELVAIRSLPRRLAIIGGGVIGAEFATIFRHLGSEVTMVEMAPRLLAGEDPEVGEALGAAFEAQGIRLLLATKVLGIGEDAVRTERGEVPFDKVLVATGRRPLLDSAMLDAAGIRHSPAGIRTDSRMRTSAPSVYAVGDATGLSVLAHVGIRQAIVAANTIMGVPDRMEYVIPRCVFSLPEVACVGKTEAQAQRPTVATVDFSCVAKAQLEGNRGFVKAILEKDRVVGFQMAGDGVSELAGAASLIVRNRLRPAQVAATIFPHPTLGEALRYAVLKAMGQLAEA